MSNPPTERRRYPRATIDYRGLLETAHGDRVPLRARDISGSGVFLYTEQKLSEFVEVSLTISLPAVGASPELTFQCSGIIVRAEDIDDEPGWPYGAAVHYTEIDESHRDAVCAYVTAVIAESDKGLEARGGRIAEC
jgi:hypothetical protein